MHYSHVNITPLRSGSTSIYELLSKYPEINAGIVKEPLGVGYELKKVESYIKNWKFDKRHIILDGSVMMPYWEKNIKEKMSSVFDSFYSIFIIRNPIEYIMTKIFVKILFYEHPSEISMTNLINDKKWCYKYFIDNWDFFKNIWYPSIKREFYYEKLKVVRNHYEKKEILITSIDKDDIVDDIKKFLNLKYTPYTYIPRENRTIKKMFNIESMKIYFHIKDYVRNNEKLKNEIWEDIIKVDKEYGTNLYEKYSI